MGKEIKRIIVVSITFIFVLVFGAFVAFHHGANAGKAFVDMCVNLYNQTKDFFNNLPQIFQ